VRHRGTIIKDIHLQVLNSKDDMELKEDYKGKAAMRAVRKIKWESWD
jgi:hypothetical protein